MTKTLIIMSHPDVAQSSSQQFLLAAIKGEEQIQIRHLESILAEQESNHFDKRIERACLQEAERIIFQFRLRVICKESCVLIVKVLQQSLCIRAR